MTTVHPFLSRFAELLAAPALAALELPGRKSEDYRFFDLRPIVDAEWTPAPAEPVNIDAWRLVEAGSSTVVVRNGRFDAAASRLDLPDGAHVAPLSALPAREQQAVRDALGTPVKAIADDPFAAINAAGASDPLCIVVAPDTAVEPPIHVLYVGSGSRGYAAPRLVVLAGAGARATVVEDFRGDDEVFTNARTEVVLHENANMHHVRVQREAPSARHVSRVAVRVGRFARYDSVHLTFGAGSSRNDVWVSHDGEDGWSRIDGLAMVDGEREADTHSAIDNTRPRCQSHQLHKCVVDDRGHAVFNGKIFVRKGAQQIDAYQLNRNLLLSPRAKVDTKPQLEILADDVRCTHGATVGQLDDEQLFYLQSRGLGPELARSTLTYAFAAEVIDSIEVPTLARQLEALARQRTMQGGELS